MSLCALQGTSRSDYDIEVLNGNEHEYIEMVNESISNELWDILERSIGLGLCLQMSI